jgi:hypothetical protein
MRPVAWRISGGLQSWGCPLSPRERRVRGMVYSRTMKITSTTDLEFPGLQFAIRQGEVKDLPADPEAAAFIVASVYIREVPESQSETTREDP